MANDFQPASGKGIQEIVFSQKQIGNPLVPLKHDFDADNFAGGVNNRDADTLVENNHLTDALNVIADAVNSLTKRNGYKALLTAPLPSGAVSMFEFNKYDGTAVYLVSTNTTLYQLSADKKTYTALTLPAGVTLTTGIKDFFTIKNNCYMLTGATYLQYDGTTITECAYTPTSNELTTYGANTLTGPKACTRAVVHKGRVFFTGEAANPHRVYFSMFDNVQYFPANYIINFYTELGDRTTGLRIFSETVIITKTESIGFLDATDPDPLKWLFKRLNVHTGAISGKAVVPISNYLVYPSNEGFYALTNINVVGALATVPISQLIPQTIKSIGDFSSSVGIYYNGKYYCKAGSYVLVYDYNSDFKPWWIWNNIDATQFLKTKDDKLWFCSTDGQIYEFVDNLYRDKATYAGDGVTLNGGVAITAYAFTKNFDFGFPSSVKQFKKFRLVVRNYDPNTIANTGGSTIHFTCLVDWLEVTHNDIVANWSLWGVAQWGDYFTQATKADLKPVRLPKRGRTFMFGFRNEVIDQPFTIYELIGKFKEKVI